MKKLLSKLNIKKKRQDQEKKRLIITGLVAFALGMFVANVIPSNHNPNYELASRTEIKQAKADIEAAYFTANTEQCNNENNPIVPFGTIENFKKYLRVNRYANRAVFRNCVGFDQMLYKDSSGTWQIANININLDLRANPAWQYECLIDDITEADDVIRPENSSIDTYNLVECRMLDEYAQVRKFIESDPNVPEITNEDIQAYIDAAEEFTNPSY